MASVQDEHFAQKAIELARHAANTIEEAQQYVDGIADLELKKKVQAQLDDIV